MIPTRRFALTLLSVAVFAALPCVHTTMGDTALSFSLYSMFFNAPIQLSAREALPWITFAFAIGLGASLAFRPVGAARARRLAQIAVVAALACFCDQCLAILKGYTQPTVIFLPPIQYRAGVGLWCMLAALILASVQAWQLPRGANPADR